ncbi:MAG: Maltodextrin ABC transporter, substrate-binding protein MdxE, partial [uncultured Rubrobacteraceae bacterium]
RVELYGQRHRGGQDRGDLDLYRVHVGPRAAADVRDRERPPANPQGPLRGRRGAEQAAGREARPRGAAEHPPAPRLAPLLGHVARDGRAVQRRPQGRRPRRRGAGKPPEGAAGYSGSSAPV